ncbi:MAG: hypothetical protein MI923_20900, partial [Phycisphaerales bacterium]|nr:hypothetical protein [Phycisphaerales bacterium]
ADPPPTTSRNTSHSPPAETIAPTPKGDASPGESDLWAWIDESRGASVGDVVASAITSLQARERLFEGGIDETYWLLSQLQEEELPQAIRLAEQVTNVDQRRILLEVMLTRWSESEPRAAATYAEQRLTPKERESVMKGIIAGWSKTDPEAAYEWLQEKSDIKGISTHLQNTLFHFWARRDLDAALAAAQNSKDMESALYGISSLVIEERYRSAFLGKIEALAEDSFRHKAIEQVILNWTVTQPAEAGAWLDGLVLGKEDRTVLERRLVRYWSLHDHEGAAHWLLEHSDQETLPGNLEYIMSSWAKEGDPNAAARWIADVGLGGQTDQAVKVFSKRVVSKDPESAFEWAKIISSESVRHEALVDVVSHWVKQDREAAEEYLLGSDLSSERAQSILREASGSQ